MAKLIADFTDVESGGGRVRIPEGDYQARVKNVKTETSKAGNEMLVWEFEITQGKYKGKSFKDYTVLTAEALWKLKQLLETIGVKVPSSRVDLTPVLKKVRGKELGITVTDDEYENRISSKVSDYIDLDTLSDFEDEDEEEEDDEEDEDEEEEEAPAPKRSKKKGKKKKKKVEDEDDEEIEDLDLEGL